MIPLKLSRGAVQVRMRVALVMKKRHLRSEVICVTDVITIFEELHYITCISGLHRNWL
jgi:hypothetical protein